MRRREDFHEVERKFDAVWWNHERYYRLARVLDSLIRLGGFAACLMTCIKMTKSERRNGASVMGGAVLRVCAIAALFGLLAGPMEAADAQHAHARRGVQSAGVVETHGHIRETASTRRNERELVAETPRTRRSSRSSRSASAKTSSARVSRSRSRDVQVSSARARGRKQRELVVEHPAVMSRASKKRVVARSVRETAAVRKQEQAPAVAMVKEDGLQKVVTVEDFLRAARDRSSQPASEIAATGVSHPDMDERIEAYDAPAAVKRSMPMVMADDAPKPVSRKQRVVEGFGSEVAMLPGVSATRATRKMVAPVDDWSRDDSATRQSITDDAVKPMVVPLYSRSGKLITPAPLKGSREVLVHQNVMADQEGLSRIQDDSDLERMADAHLLMRIPETAALDVNDELPMNRRYARPWTVKFVGDLSRSYYAKFHDALRLSSAVRTVDFQLRLQRVNGNAAAVEGETASPHLTGQAIDFGKSGMSRVEIAWMRAYLLPLMQAGKIDVEEEFQQSCFHISVYSGYAPKKRVQRMDVAMTKGSE